MQKSYLPTSGGKFFPTYVEKNNITFGDTRRKSVSGIGSFRDMSVHEIKGKTLLQTGIHGAVYFLLVPVFLLMFVI